MQLDRQAERRGAVKDAGHFLGRKGDALAEPVHGIDQPLGMGGLHPGDHHLVDIASAVALVFGGQGMGGQPGGHDPQRPFATDPPGDAQHPQFGVQVQPVARLDFHRRHALGDQVVGAPQRGGQQFVVAGGAGGADGGQDAAAGAGDLFIAGAVQAHVEFARPVAAEHQMGVTVDQPRRHQPPAHGPPVPVLRRVGGLAGIDDAPALDRNGGALGQRKAVRSCLCQRDIGENHAPLLRGLAALRGPYYDYSYSVKRGVLP